ncbi:endoplasmic reticulum-golgi intermediate compartment-domain-containing protein [Pavlovales sp. CCMP2436]|nr:endoplasmic reticulum-golgi intermediate compartment-domain-containing protein [Pavlovales sp. CCMP2436]
MAPGAGSMMAFDAFPKTLDELKERTLGGAASAAAVARQPSGATAPGLLTPAHCVVLPCCAVSIAATFLIALLFVSEFRQYRQIETIDRLDVDVSNTNSKIAINLDITLPSLPCSEFVVDVVDESGVQQLHARPL